MEHLDIFTLSGVNRVPIRDIYGMGDETQLTLETYNINVFLTLLPEFKDLFDDNLTNRYNIMFSLYLDIAKQVFSDWEYGELLFYCVTFFIAHHLQLTLGRNKNNNNVANLNSTKPSDNVARNIGEKKDKEKVMSSFEREYAMTEYGQMLYPIMKFVGMNRIRGVY